MGDALTAVAQAKHKGEKIPASMRIALIVFVTKPKKASYIIPLDKRRISLLNSDFKLIEDLDARRFRKISSYCLSPVQYFGGKTDKSIMVSQEQETQSMLWGSIRWDVVVLLTLTLLLLLTGLY